MGAGQSQTDHDLILAVREGGEIGRAAFAQLYERHKAWAMSVALRFQSDPERASDAVQDAFLSLLRKGGALYAGAQFRTILYLPIKHAAMRQSRRSSRIGSKRMHSTGDVAGTIGVVSVELETGSDDNTRVRDAVMQLPDAHREVLLMRCVDDLSVAEVAAALDIPEGTVKSRLYHAVRGLRGVLGGDETSQ
ncbi:MAG: RNA polymerase sigma factor [Phycisphaeraceae bacterium]|nr:RNA polymerase sigma factor [Phycisphaerales bacterium]MCB9860517.1 RNA polymerase sigma factor [Phycisphaeraceae bacterium]